MPAGASDLGRGTIDRLATRRYDSRWVAWCESSHRGRSGRETPMLEGTPMLMRRWILGLSACLLATGCGGDTAFTKSGAAALAEVVWHVATAPGLEVFDTMSSSYDLEVACTEGGKAQSSGTIEGDGSNRTMEGTSTVTDCAEYQPPCLGWVCNVDDPVITLSGNVYRVTEVAFIRSDRWTDIDIEGRLSGELAWEADYGESGICELDLIAVSEWDLIGDPVYRIRSQGRMSGTVCGTPVDVEGAPRGLLGPPGVAGRPSTG